MDGVQREVKPLLLDFTASCRTGIESLRATVIVNRMRIVGLMVILTAFAAAQGTVVPRAADGAMQVDGRIDAQEWGGAVLVPMPQDGVVIVKQVDNRVWLAIVPETKHPTYVDLFLQTEDGVVHNLHASLQWGERIVSGDKWTDTEPATRWGLPTDWQANRIEYAPGGRDTAEVTRASFKPYAAHEYGVSREKFGGKTWRIRIEVRDFAGREPDRIFPAGSDRHEPGGWWTLRLE